MNKFLFFLFFLGCSQVHRIGLKEHTFSEQPRKIVWLQIAGFDLNHIGLLKFTNWNKSRGSVLTNLICTGNTWQYDLYDLRPTAYSSMYSQVTGKNNSKGNKCDDYSQKPYWRILAEEKGFEFLLVEQGAKSKESFLKGQSCPDSKNWFEGGVTLSRSGLRAQKQEDNFHYSENRVLDKGRTYYDRSCKSKKCYTSLYQSISSIVENTLNKKKKYIIHVRDFSYQKLLEKGDYKNAAETLVDIERVYQLFTERYSESDVLFLVTGVSGKILQYPRAGKNWKNFEKRSKRLASKSSLMSPVLSGGGRSENFCGIYNQSELFNRLFYVKKKFRIDIGN